jgi:hypothetical protein
MFLIYFSLTLCGHGFVTLNGVMDFTRPSLLYPSKERTYYCLMNVEVQDPQMGSTIAEDVVCYCPEEI